MSTDRHQWKVLLDAAAFVPTRPLDLTAFPADFVTVSFYKIMGYPTGLGALLVRNSCCLCVSRYICRHCQLFWCVLDTDNSHFK